jgi:Neuraminidase (sialidase)
MQARLPDRLHSVEFTHRPARHRVKQLAEITDTLTIGNQHAQDAPVTVAASPKARGHIHPSICRAKDGTLVVVYKGPQVLMRARSADGGKTWEPPEAIATSAKRPDVIREVKTYEVYPGTVDTLPDGRLIVTWNYIADDKAKDRYYERALLYTLSSDQGRTWSEQQLIGPVAGKHLGAVRHNVLPWSEGRWLLPLRAGAPQLFDPKKNELTVFPVKTPNDKQHAFQQIVRTSKGTLLAMGPVFLRSTDEGKTWTAIPNFPADAKPIDNAEGRYLTTLPGGRVLVTWGVGTANKGLRYNYSADDGQTWNTGQTVTLLPETSIAARYYSARTIQVDDQHVGTVYLSGSVVYFLKVPLDRVAKAR